MSGRAIMRAGSAVRLAYGLGALLAPGWMSARRVAPDVRGHPPGRMDFRGFGGLHVAIALATLTTRHPRAMLRLNLGCELTDAAATALEWRDRGRPDRIVIGSLALATTGVALWSTALRRL